ncbi:hypothetical protein CR513_45757, partial [Mucuna pruriens]
MKPPPRFVETFKDQVYRLKKSLYGLKQSPKAYFDRLARFIKGLAYSQGQSDDTLFKRSIKGKVSILIVYPRNLMLKILDSFVNMVSQFMHSPSEEHLEVIYKILWYLKGTPRKGLFGKTEKRGIEVYTDAGWAGSVMEKRSTSGYCTFLWGNLVTWRSKKPQLLLRTFLWGSLVTWSKKQNIVARSSLKLSSGQWLKGYVRVVKELGKPVIFPMQLFCNNKVAISIAHNPVLHDQTKHVEIDKHFIKEKLEKEIADVLTKGLLRQPFDIDLVSLFTPVMCASACQSQHQRETQHCHLLQPEDDQALAETSPLKWRDLQVLKIGVPKVQVWRSEGQESLNQLYKAVILGLDAKHNFVVLSASLFREGALCPSEVALSAKNFEKFKG